MSHEPQATERQRGKGEVTVHIGELVLHGFPIAERRQIASALESELARLIEEGGLVLPGRSPVTLGVINAEPIRVTAGAEPHTTGAHIARAVYRTLQQSAGTRGRATKARSGKGGHNL